MTGTGGDGAVRLGARGLVRRFGTLTANDRVDFAARRGTVHAIVGGNGAGKSTLMRILQGVDQPDEGSVIVDGKPVAFRHPADAFARGIGMVHQEFMLVPGLSLLENLILAREPADALGRLDIPAALAAARALEHQAGVTLDWHMPVDDAPVHVRQIVEILRLLYRGADVLILDEPTAVLTPQEADKLFELLALWRSQGSTVLLITHKLREIMAITDRVTVMRQGAIVATRETKDTSQAELAELMVGRRVATRVPKSAAAPGAEILRVEHLSCIDERGAARLEDISFSVRAGEIVGIAGVSGNGQSELLQVLAGIRRPTGGALEVCGRKVDAAHPADPAEMRGLGVAHVPEDRLRQGLVPAFLASETSILGYQDREPFCHNYLLDGPAVGKHCAELMDRFDVRPRTPGLLSSSFSGGNQQKLILAREMARHPRLLLVGQPTRGVDIGGIAFIHRCLLDYRDRGGAVLLVSEELDEIIALADRIVVLFEGRRTGEIRRGDGDIEAIGRMMLGERAA